MAFGTTGRLKSDVAEGVTKVVARLSARRGGRVGVVAAGTPRPIVLPPAGGRRALGADRPHARRRRHAGRRAQREPGRRADPRARARPPAGPRRRRLRLPRRALPGCARCACWSPPASRSSPSRSSTRASSSCPDGGVLSLVDPETGELVEVDTRSNRLRQDFAGAEARRREQRRHRAAPHRRAPRRRAHRPRLAARPREPPRMSFADPVWLLALLVVPLGALALWAVQARRRRDALRFPAAATLAGVAPAHARLAPLAADGAAARSPPRRSPCRSPSPSAPSPSPSSRPPSSSSPTRPARWPRPTSSRPAWTPPAAPPRASSTRCRTRCASASSATRRSRTPCCARRRTATPCARRSTAWSPTAGPRPATRSPRRSRRSSPRTRRPSARPPRSCCSPTARRPTGATRSTSHARPQRLKIPIYTVALGTPDGVVPGGPGGFTPVPPDPETLKRIADVSGGRGVHRRGRGRRPRHLRQARQPDRHEARAARDDRRVRRRRVRPAAAGRRRLACGSAVGSRYGPLAGRVGEPTRSISSAVPAPASSSPTCARIRAGSASRPGSCARSCASPRKWL